MLKTIFCCRNKINEVQKRIKENNKTKKKKRNTHTKKHVTIIIVITNLD